MRPLVLGLALLFCASAALAEGKQGAVFLFPDGAPDELTDDMTEVLLSNLSEGSDLRMLPKERFLARAQEISGRRGAECLQMPDCVRQVGFALKLSLVAVGTLKQKGEHYDLTIRRYSVAGGEDQDFTYERLADVSKLIGALKDVAGHLREAEGAYLVIESRHKGATVFLDDKFVGVLPLKAIPIAEGFHKLLVRHKGYQDFRGKVSCKIGTKCEVPVTLVEATADAATVVVDPAAGAAAAKAVSATSGGRVNPWRIVGFTGAGLGLASVATGVVFLVKAKAVDGWLHDNCATSASGQRYCSYSEAMLKDKADEGEQSMLLANALLGTGIGLTLASTAVLVFLWDHGQEPPAAAVVPTVAPGFAGVSATFSF